MPSNRLKIRVMNGEERKAMRATILWYLFTESKQTYLPIAPVINLLCRQIPALQTDHCFGKGSLLNFITKSSLNFAATEAMQELIKEGLVKSNNRIFSLARSGVAPLRLKKEEVDLMLNLARVSTEEYLSYVGQKSGATKAELLIAELIKPEFNGKILFSELINLELDITRHSYVINESPLLEQVLREDDTPYRLMASLARPLYQLLYFEPDKDTQTTTN